MSLEWKTSVVFPIFKKEDRRMFLSYWGITLLCLPGKVYTRMLEKRSAVETPVQEEQSGFRPYQKTVDLLFTLVGLLEG